MVTVEILLNPDSPAYNELEAALKETLNGLSTITYEQKKQPIEAGKLFPGWEQVVAYIVKHPGDTVMLTSALLKAVSNLLRWISDKEGRPIVIVVQGKRLQLPASDQTQKRFLKSLGRGKAAIPEGTSQRRSPRRKKR